MDFDFIRLMAWTNCLALSSALGACATLRGKTISPAERSAGIRSFLVESPETMACPGTTAPPRAPYNSPGFSGGLFGLLGCQEECVPGTDAPPGIDVGFIEGVGIGGRMLFVIIWEMRNSSAG